MTHIKAGDRVGVGAQSGSCRDCIDCDTHWEQYCSKNVGTYQGKWEDGTPSQGGYSNYNRCKAHFAVKIPDGLSSEVAAPMMCAGGLSLTLL